MDRKFDWVPRHDPRSRLYSLREVIPRGVPRREKLWKPGLILDQGSEGACVGFGWTAEALASPVRVDLTRLKFPHARTADPTKFAQYVYRSAKLIDEWAGENYEGTSVLAGAKVMENVGLLKGYRWAFSLEEVTDALMLRGPVVIGIPWYDSMYETDGRVLKVDGQVVGGHCLLVIGYKPNVPEFGNGPGYWLQNSWGPLWGHQGLALINSVDLYLLLRQDGEACTPVYRSYGRIAPQLVRNA